MCPYSEISFCGLPCSPNPLNARRAQLTEGAMAGVPVYVELTKAGSKTSVRADMQFTNEHKEEFILV